jgi:hypothetical protein
MNPRAILPAAAAGLLINVGTASADDARPDARAEFFEQKIRPLLAGKCYSCHSVAARKSKGGLRLDSREGLLRGGDSGPALVAGKPDESLIIRAVRHLDGLDMPPGGKLPDEAIADLVRWVASGAYDPRDAPAKPASAPQSDPAIDRSHWAFQPPKASAPPAVRDAAWPVNDVDRFLLAELESRGLRPAAPAPKAVLLRRVYLDLIGIPPAPAELDAFEADPAPDAYEKVVDRLLASPLHAQRWARHWMDVWRYSEAWGLGDEMRNSHRHIRHWRDWIVDSLAADKGYDQMVREMLAADELYPDDLDRLRAGGFLARQYFLFNRNTWLDEAVEHTSKAFLGLTMNCVKCHEHKFDPVPQVDYYRLRAFFEPYQLRTDQLPGEPDLARDGLVRPFDCNPDAPTYLFVRGEERNPVTAKPLSPGVPEVLAFAEPAITPVALPATARFPGLRAFVLADHLRAAESRRAAARKSRQQAEADLAGAAGRWVGSPGTAAALTAALLTVAAETAAEDHAGREVTVLRLRSAADRARHADPIAGAEPALAAAADALSRAAAVAEQRQAASAAGRAVLQAGAELARADPARAAAARGAAAKKFADALKAAGAAGKALADLERSPKPTHTPLRGSIKTPESNVETDASRNRPYPATSTGRRTALARWLTDPRNPLPARVAVNHVWARHFGRPLVATVFDFGRNGARPTHPALLDTLAADFVANGWSLRRLHRLLVTSRAYRMSSSNAANSDADRAADPENTWYRRMNPVRMDAQVLRDSLLHLAGELDASLGGPTVPRGAESRRRSLYLFQSNNDQDPFLAGFDNANVLDTYLRSESVVPQQALALANAKIAIASAAAIAARLSRQAGSDDAAFARTAFRTVLATPPTEAELSECLRMLSSPAGRKAPADPVLRSRTALVRALLNHNDFITVR